MVIRIPQDKLQDIAQIITKMVKTRKVTSWELQQLVGKLSFIEKLVPAEKCFIKGIYQALAGVPHHRHIGLRSPVLSDLRMWKVFPSQVQGLDANHGHQSTSCISHRGIHRCSKQCKVRLGSMPATLRVVDVQPVGGRFLPEVSTANRLPRTIQSFSCHCHLGSSPNGLCHTFPVGQHPYSVYA